MDQNFPGKTPTLTAKWSLCKPNILMDIGSTHQPHMALISWRKLPVFPKTTNLKKDWLTKDLTISAQFIVKTSKTSLILQSVQFTKCPSIQVLLVIPPSMLATTNFQAVGSQNDQYCLKFIKFSISTSFTSISGLALKNLYSFFISISHFFKNLHKKIVTLLYSRDASAIFSLSDFLRLSDSSITVLISLIFCSKTLSLSFNVPSYSTLTLFISSMMIKCF